MVTNNDTIDNDIQVCGHRVLLDAHFVKNEIQDGPLKGFKTESDESFDRSKAATITGKVVAVGPTAWRAFDGNDPNWKPWAEVGDIVIFAKYGGKFITVKDHTYILINDEDVQAVVAEEE
jgi:co-chaperonin GroES (HSP10)